MSDLDWGPGRPAAVSWAGVLMFLLGTFQLVVMIVALILDARALLLGPAFAFSVVFILVFAFLQIVAAVGVIRLRASWRTFALGLAAVGAVIHTLKLFGGGDALLMGVKIALAAAYIAIFESLRRSGPAFE